MTIEEKKKAGTVMVVIGGILLILCAYLALATKSSTVGIALLPIAIINIALGMAAIKNKTK